MGKTVRYHHNSFSLSHLSQRVVFDRSRPERVAESGNTFSPINQLPQPQGQRHSHFKRQPANPTDAKDTEPERADSADQPFRP